MSTPTNDPNVSPRAPRVDAWLCVHDNELRERGFVKLPILALTQTRAERWCRVHERAVRVIELRPGDLLIPAEARDAAVEAMAQALDAHMEAHRLTQFDLYDEQKLALARAALDALTRLAPEVPRHG